MANNRDNLRWLILNHEQPLVFKGMLNWDMLQWNLDKWKDVFGDEILRYRCGKRQITKNPQWEKNGDYVHGTFSELLEFDSPDKFAYCDYSHLIEHFTNISELQSGIQWDDFGFSNYNSSKSTIWIGTAGAHTNCHQDTYGCNLVAQVFGSKRWILFPPEENMQATRVPYEESSIFSKLNLFAPNVKNFDGISRCKSVILNPGDVLFVPHHWWHYVENLETAISVNIWITKDTDIEDQMKESLVQLFVSRLVKDLDTSTKEAVLTPAANNSEFDQQTSLVASLNIIDVCKGKLQSSNKKRKLRNGKTTVNVNNQFTTDGVLDAYKSSVLIVPDLPQDEFRKFLRLQYGRFPPYDSSDEPEFEYDNILNNVINAFTNENVINLIKENLLNK